MRALATALVCVLTLITPVQAQTAFTASMLIPSPLGAVLTVGMWIYDRATKKQVYYIEVAGDGIDAEQARQNGFRLAVEQALGSLISSETEVQNGRIQRDEIISYASGFVDRFEIVNSQATNNGVRVTMRVWVGRSALADRLLNRSERSGEIDGARASVQLQTLNQERATGDRLLQTVLNDFPKRAFDIELSPADIVRNNRSAQIEIPFAVTWNQDYLKSLWTALEATGQKTSKPASVIAVNPGSGWMFKSYGGQARFDDTQKYQLLVSRMIGTEPSILVSLRNNNRDLIYRACFNYQELDHQSQYLVTNRRFVELTPYSATAFVDGSFKLRGKLAVPVNHAVLQQITTVEMDIVTKNQCPMR